MIYICRKRKWGKRRGIGFFIEREGGFCDSGKEESRGWGSKKGKEKGVRGEVVDVNGVQELCAREMGERRIFEVSDVNYSSGKGGRGGF